MGMVLAFQSWYRETHGSLPWSCLVRAAIHAKARPLTEMGYGIAQSLTDTLLFNGTLSTTLELTVEEGGVLQIALG
jgi:hypothetical protein